MSSPCAGMIVICLSFTILVGCAGQPRWQEHARTRDCRFLVEHLQTELRLDSLEESPVWASRDGRIVVSRTKHPRLDDTASDG